MIQPIKIIYKTHWLMYVHRVRDAVCEMQFKKNQY
jgi:hypothetical protein